jgi:5-formyltetrahydrofolate cyclo-ligase
MNKDTLRSEVVLARTDRRRNQSLEQRQLHGERAAQQMRDLPVIRTAAAGSIVASYEALASEPPTEAIHATLIASGVQVLVPVHEVNGEYLSQMYWLDVQTREVIAESTAALASISPLAVITPALAAGRDGTRLGKGKAFYDQLFAGLQRFPSGPLRIALVWDGELFDSVPVEAHDESVDVVVTC